ncbi:MAG: type II toxin-antitoxin system Phd/YefM family antitoxin [Pseudonocardia sp.]
MREMTASEVSRNLSRVLDATENGETIAVTRNGERVALLVPAPRANGAAVAELLRSWRGKLEFGPEWDEMLEENRAMPARLEDPWRD